MTRPLSIFFLSVLCLVATPHSSTAAEERLWVDIGQSNIGPWRVYIDTRSINRDDRGHMHVHVLDDHRVTQSGVDRFNEKGELAFRDPNYQFRSTITHYVLDCDRQEEVILSMAYYDGDMGEGTLVLFDQPGNVYWSDSLCFIEPTLASTVCEWPAN